MKHSKLLLFLSAIIVLAACNSAPAQSQTTAQPPTHMKASDASTVSGPLAPYQSDAREGWATAIFAGGCFWCVEKDFEGLKGVIEVVSGYTGGHLDDPDYKTVSYTETGHYEAAEVLYNPEIITYRELVDFYWTTVDPTDDTGQFCDKGSSYRTAIFVQPDQVDIAQASLTDLLSDKPFDADIVTPILPAVTFYDAERYHQNYYRKNPLRYRAYRTACRRDATLKRLWGDAAKGGK